MGGNQEVARAVQCKKDSTTCVTTMSGVYGYDYKFVDGEPPNKYICAICTLVSCDPQQASCCGNVYCKSCLQQLKDIGQHFNCPTCRHDLTNKCFPDRRADLEIKSLQVYCTNNKQTAQADNTCSWKGRLKDIDDHLQQCLYQILSCTNGCGENIERKQLQHHLESNCPKRLIKCQYCNEEDIYQVITGEHLKECPQYLVQCTNEGCGQEVVRFQIKPHKRSCPKEIISCEYSTIGCVKRMKREEQEEHNEQSMDEHLQMAVKEIADLKSVKETSETEIADLKRYKETSETEIADLKRCKETSDREITDLKRAKETSDREIADLKTSLSQHIRFNEFSNRKVNNITWCSPGFYTSPGGYKMSLCVYANGNGIGKGTHVSCYIRLMSGEYDNILEWPFQGKVTIELLNQLEDKNHCKYTIGFDESTPQECKERVVGKQYGRRWGHLRFIFHFQLGYNSSLNRRYLIDDTLYFRVSVKVTSTTKPWLVRH